MESIISVIGSIVSLVGTSISWRQAQKASKARNTAQQYRDEIVNSRRTSDFSSLLSSLRHALASMRKYGPSSTIESLDGVNPQRDAEDVQSFVELLNEHRSLFLGRVNPTIELVNSSRYEIDAFVSAFPNVEQVRSKGMAIYSILNDFLPILTRELEKLRERPVSNN